MTLAVERTGDLDRVAGLLRAAGLPTADVGDAPATFYLGRDDGVVAVGGLEDCGDAALLRSVAVPAAARGRGYGTAMTEALIDRAADYDAVYLLTTDAADFFAGLGFERVPRRSLPEPVCATTQFADLCPASATAMRRRL